MELPCSKYLTKLSTEIMDRTDSSSAMMLLQYGGDDSDEENLNEQDNASGPTGRKTPEERKRRNSSKGGEPLTPSRRISEESFGKQAAALISDEEGDHHPPPIPDRWEPDMAQPLIVNSNTATVWALKFEFFLIRCLKYYTSALWPPKVRFKAMDGSWYCWCRNKPLKVVKAVKLKLVKGNCFRFRFFIHRGLQQGKCLKKR